MKIREFETYRAVYCGLCGQLGKSFGPTARMVLSYDFAFFCTLSGALADDSPGVEKRHCFVNPLKKLPICTEREILQFGADLAIIMLYYKLLDNMRDDGIFRRAGWRMLHPGVRSAWNRAARHRPDSEAVIADAMRRQAELERAATASLDEACDPTAFAMGQICRALSADNRQQRVLERLGYCIGRFVYLCDALDDLEQDVRTGSYNPLATRFHLNVDSSATEYVQAHQAARYSLNLTIAEAVSAFDLLKVNRYGPILDNVISLGLNGSVEEIMRRKQDRLPQKQFLKPEEQVPQMAECDTCTGPKEHKGESLHEPL